MFFDGLIVLQVLFYDAMQYVFIDVVIPDAITVDDHNRPARAHAEAFGDAAFDALRQAKPKQ